MSFQTDINMYMFETAGVTVGDGGHKLVSEIGFMGGPHPPTVGQIHFIWCLFHFGGFFGSNFCVFGPIGLILALFDHNYLQFDDPEGILGKK